MAQTTPDTSCGPYGECIFFSFVFIDTNDCLLHIQLQIYVIWRQVEGCNNGKWPKWRRTHRLGLVVSVFFFPFIFIDTNACLLHIQLLIYKLREMEGYDYGKGPKRPSFVPLVTTLSFFSFHIFWIQFFISHIYLVFYVLHDRKMHFSAWYRIVLQSLAWPPGPLVSAWVGPRAEVLQPCPWTVYHLSQLQPN